MPTFIYKATVKGKVKSGTIEAEDEKEATQKLRQQKIRPTSLKKKSGGFVEGMNKKPITGRDIVLFTRQFSTMVDAGLPIVQCLDILGKGAENKTLGEIIIQIKGGIEVGGNLSNSMRKFPDVFDDLFCNLIEAGELGGILDIILRRLSEYIEKSESLKKKIKAALVYPSMIVFVAVSVVAFLMIFVIPAFAEMFSGGGAELPGPTQIVMDVSDLFRTKSHYMLGTLMLIFFSIKRIYKTEKGRIIIDRILLSLPVVGNLVQRISVAKFTRTLGTLISSGVPLIEALDICARTAGNKIVEIAVFKTIEAIKEGETIAAPLSRESVFPMMVIQMIDVGENAGSLDIMLIKIADFYDEEVDIAVEAMTALLEPLLMIFLGIVVGFIVVAMYLPIFKMGESI
jgi:type IV pilus assembly protein PilC